MTIHAGEAFGLPSIWEAVQFCNAERLGHGVRIVDDIIEKDGEYHLGRLASFVRDRRIPLEVCPTSNVHTGAATSIATHPIELLRKLRFRVTLNTDNRLMSGISMSSEFETCADIFGWTLSDMEWMTFNAAKSSFYHFDQRLAMINTVIKPGYAALAPSRRAVTLEIGVTASTASCAYDVGPRDRRTSSGRGDLDVGLQFRFGPRRSDDDATRVAQSQEHAVRGPQSFETLGEVEDVTDLETTKVVGGLFA